MGRASLRVWNARRHLQPKCGAKAKSHGGPCAQIAMANGRCFYHGGAVPSGDGYHMPVWPHRDAPNASAKLNKKLARLDRAAKKRAQRLKRMTPGELAAYRAWQKAHQPGSAAARERQREYRRQAKETRILLSTEPPAPSPEVQALQTEIDELKAELLEMEFRKGVFG